jgi:alpha-methylacyl-CoA racemase
MENVHPRPPHPAQPLAGITILDLTRLLPGPMATLHLADMGATVIKIEDHGVGDYARTMSHVKHELSQLFIAVNRGKELMRLDLKAPEDKARFLAMVDSADAVVESFRPGVMDRLGLGWEVLKARNPKLVMCAITGYGQSGPLAQLAGHDINYLALSGMLAQTTDDEGHPVLPNLQVADLLGGAQTAVQGMLAALLAVKMGGHGRFVDVSMTDAVVAHNIMPLLALNHAGHTAPPARDFLTGGLPCYAVYCCSDGKYLAVGALELKFWQSLCDVIARPEWKDRHWSLGQTIGGEDALALKSALSAVFLEKRRDEWAALFAPADCCVTPVLSLDEARHSAHFRSRQLMIEREHPTEGKYWSTRSAIQFQD